MKKKYCVITGGNAGIGYQTALQLAEKGFAIIILSRSSKKGIKAVEEIRQLSGNQEVSLVQCDLSSQKSIQQAANEITATTSEIEVLINNAGTWHSKLNHTVDGIEMMFAVNHLAYFLLTHYLIGPLALSGNGRIVNIGSDSHFQGKMHFDDLYLTKRYHGLRSYAQSKLANILFTYELDRRLKERNIAISSNCVQPGLVKTDIGIKNVISFHALAWKIRRLSGVSPEEGARTSVYLASSDEVKDISGKYWEKCMPKPSSKRSYNELDAQKLWDESLKLCNIDDYFSSNRAV